MRREALRNIRILFWGDSICVGQHVSLHKGWVTRISACFSEKPPAADLRVLVSNVSANGRTTRQALEQMPYEVQSHSPELLIVQYGMNDCNYWQSDGGVPRVSPKAFEANLEEIIARALRFGVRRVFLNTNHPTGRDQSLLPNSEVTYQESLERYNQILRAVVARQPSCVRLTDIEQVFKAHVQGQRERLLELLMPGPDLLHPSERGHELYFQAVYPAVEQAVLEVAAEGAERMPS